MIKTSGNWFYIVNSYFPWHFVNAFGLDVLLSYRPSSFEFCVRTWCDCTTLSGICPRGVLKYLHIQFVYYHFPTFHFYTFLNNFILQRVSGESKVAEMHR